MKIVVGIDGSAESTGALRFAAAEAGATGADLLAVTVWEVSTHAARYLSQEHVDDAMIPWMGEFIDEVLGAKGADVTKLAASGSAGEPCWMLPPMPINWWWVRVVSTGCSAPSWVR